MSVVLTEPAVSVTPPPRRCGIEEVFARPFIELITLAPRNPVVRGLILAQTRQLPGAECATFEQIKDWVETTCDKPERPPGHGPRGTASDGIRIPVEFSETEYGRASYSVRRYGSEEFALDAEELLKMARDAIDQGENLQAVVQQVVDTIHDEAWDRCDPSLEDYGEYDYEEHDSDSTDNSRLEFSKPQVRDRLVSFLRSQHPDLLEELT